LALAHIKKHQHDAIAADIMRNVKSKFTVKNCPTENQLTVNLLSDENYIEEEHENTKKQADWVVEDDKGESCAYDLTIRDPKELDVAVKYKKKKYKKIYFRKEVKPICVSYAFTIHPESL